MAQILLGTSKIQVLDYQIHLGFDLKQADLMTCVS